MKQTKQSIMVLIALLVFVFTACEKDKLLDFYNNQPKDPEIIGRWERTDLELNETNSGKVKEWIFEANGSLKYLHIEKHNDVFELTESNGVEYKFYTKDNIIHTLIVGDGLKSATRESQLTIEYKITADTLETWHSDPYNPYFKYVKVK